MLVAAFAVVAGCAKAPAEVEVMVEEAAVVEVVMPTAEEVVVEVMPTEEAPAAEADAATEVEVF